MAICDLFLALYRQFRRKTLQDVNRHSEAKPSLTNQYLSFATSASTQPNAIAKAGRSPCPSLGRSTDVPVRWRWFVVFGCRWLSASSERILVGIARARNQRHHHYGER